MARTQIEQQTPVNQDTLAGSREMFMGKGCRVGGPGLLWLAALLMLVIGEYNNSAPLLPETIDPDVFSCLPVGEIL